MNPTLQQQLAEHVERKRQMAANRRVRKANGKREATNREREREVERKRLMETLKRESANAVRLHERINPAGMPNLYALMELARVAHGKVVHMGGVKFRIGRFAWGIVVRMPGVADEVFSLAIATE
jgi:hypothetical protein